MLLEAYEAQDGSSSFIVCHFQFKFVDWRTWSLI